MSNRFLAGVLALLVVGLIWYANGLPGLGPKVDPSTPPQQAEVKKDEAQPAAEPVQQAPAPEAPKVGSCTGSAKGGRDARACASGKDDYAAEF